jgi:guanosine-3',5'-bis(diphosphate) 3'-pyrophosphohydrolase
VATITHLTEKLADYMTEADLKKVKEAYRFSDEMHLGQVRKSGEPYISHPIAVAEICADWKLDAQAIMAALLHDVMEDQDVKKDELIERFGAPVAHLVDGLSKLEKIEFQSQIEAQAENFRKMLLAMASDVRVILIKLADRLHNMRTLDVMAPPRSAASPSETMEVYVPIAHRLGLNNIYRELQDLSFAPVPAALPRAGQGRESGARQPARSGQQDHRLGQEHAGDGEHPRPKCTAAKNAVRHLQEDALEAPVVLAGAGRVRLPRGGRHFPNCYVALGTLHSLYKPMPGKFKDYIAIRKLNGYQSLHTTLIGPYGTPVEFQIRTQDMHRTAESGVAAHWLYKTGDMNMSDMQQRTHAWLQSLLDIQQQTGDSAEFLEHVKVDLFPDSVYVFTPKSKIIAMPRGATPIDFAYAIHTGIGDHTVSVTINGEPAPLRTELRNGDIVEIVTDNNSRPSPELAQFRAHRQGAFGDPAPPAHHQPAGIDRARQAAADAGAGGDQRFARPAGAAGGTAAERIERQVDGRAACRHRHRQAHGGAGGAPHLRPAGRRIGLGADRPQQRGRPRSGHDLRQRRRLGAAGAVLPADSGRPDHRPAAARPGPAGAHGRLQRWPSASATEGAGPLDRGEMGHELNRRFDSRIRLLINNEKGILARVAAEIGESDGNITFVGMDEDNEHVLHQLRFTIQVKDRVHLAGPAAQRAQGRRRQPRHPRTRLIRS